MANPIISFFKWAGSKIAEAWALADTLGRVNMVLTAATLAVGVKGFMQARQMMAKGQDILANKTSAGGKLPVIYGTRRVGAQVIYMDVSANDSRDLYVVYALSVGECDEILGRTIELDGNPLTDSARFRDGGYIGSDRISSGSGSLNTASQNGTGVNAGAGQFGSNPSSRYRYVMNLHHGQATQLADPMLVASMPNWTSAHKLNGVAYIAFHAGYDKEGIWKGVPQLTVQVRGKKVFDPRDTNQTFGNVSTYKYSDNPALTFLDYISNNEYGKGLTQSQINMTTFSSAANVCDTEVDQPYFNGSAKSLTWSGNAGDDFITIGGNNPNTNWWQNKVGEIVDINDANGNLVIDGKEIKDVQRNGFYDQNDEYIVYIDDTLGSTYSSQTGSSLVKVKRFHCNGYLDANKNVMDNAKELLANMRGIFLYIDGKYELSIEDTGSSTFSINDNHIISDAGISVDYGNKDKKANKVIVEFFNANKRYELDTATVLHDANPEYYSDDGDEILEVKAEFPYISDPYIAYNMAKAILTRSRNQTTMQFLGTPEMYKLNVGDIVDLTYAGLGFSGKICRVEGLELQHSGLVSVSLIEYFDVYTWEVPPQEPVEELSNLPSAYAVKAPTGLSFTDSNASSTDRPFISWNIPTDFPNAQYRINVVDGSGNQVINRIVDVENCDLNFVPTGSYVASVTSLNTLGTESSPARFPTTGTFTIGDAPVGLGDVQANVITANEINVTNLSAISANLGSITAGDINIGSGNFTVSTAGAMTATGAAISGSFSSGSGNNIFKADTNGIYLGNTTFANAPFRVTPTGVVQSDKRITSGTGTTQATLSGEDTTYRFWSGGTSGSTADFSVSKTGEIIAKKISIYNNEGGLIFSSDAGFSDLALTQISAVTGTPVQSVSDTFSANGDTSASWQSITLVANTDLSVSVALNTLFGGDASSNTSAAIATAEALAEIPDNFTLQMQYSSDGGSNWNNIAITSGGSGNTQQFIKTTSTNPTAQQYSVDITTESEPAFFVAFADVRKGNSLSNYGSVDANGYSNITGTITNLAGSTGGTNYKFRTLVTTTDSGYNTINKVTATAPRTLTITDTSGSGFYIDNGDGSQTVPTGDITSVSVTTTSSSGLTGGQTFSSGAANFNLALAATIAGNKTFSNNVIVGGNLDVQGTTTTVNTDDLNVKDKNITLNYSTGDSSALSNGAGITIQDAVNSTTNATILWDKPNSRFTTSHGLNVTGNVTATSYYGDGSNLTGVTSTTINNNADNRIVTGSGTANTLNAESGLTYNGSALSVTGTISSGAITSTGNLHVGDGTNISMDSSANGQLEFDGNGYQGAIALDGNAMHLYHNSSARSLVLGTNETARLTISGTGGFNFESNPVQGITTLSSGAISSSGNISSAGSITANSSMNIIGATGSSGFMYIYDRDNGTSTANGFLIQKSGVNAFVRNRESTGKLFLGAGDDLDHLAIYSNGDYYAGSTKWFDQSRNLSNIGTIDSTAINTSSSGTVFSGFAKSASFYEVLNAGSTNATATSPRFYSPASGTAAISAGGAERLRLSSSGATFAGTISSGAITVDKANGTGAVVGMQLLSGSNQGDSIAINFGSTTANEYSLLYDHYTNRLNLTDGGSNVFYVAGGVVNFASAPVFGGGLVVPSLSVTGNGTIQTGAAGLIKGGYYQVGSTTVIDTSRNLTNIGTISSGAITSTGDISADDGRVRIGNPTTLSGRSSIRIDANGDSFADLVFGDNTSSTGWTNANWSISSRSSAENNALKIYRGSGQPSPYNSEFVLMEFKKDNYVSVNGVLQINNTNVIDGSRNLTNIASISTGSISSGTVTIAEGVGSGTFISLRRSAGEIGKISYSASDNVAIYGTTASHGGFNFIGGGIIPMSGGVESDNTISLGDAARNFSEIFAKGMTIGSTQVIDPSRNLTNIGTISSGAITASGTSQFTSMYVDDQIISTGDTNTYFQFNAADTARIVVGGSQKFVVNSSGVSISNGTLNMNGGNLTSVGTINSGNITATGSGNTEIKIDTSGSGQPSIYFTRLTGDDQNARIKLGDNQLIFENEGDPNSSFLFQGRGASGGLTDFVNISSSGLLINTGDLLVGDTSTALRKGAGNALRIQTNSGYVDVGAMNSGYAHIQTDRARYYFNRRIIVDQGIVSSYDEDLVMQRAENASHQLTLNTSGITATGNIRSGSDYYGNASAAVRYNGYGDAPIIQGVNGATYLYSGGTSSVCLTLQSNRTIAPQFAIGSVNNFTTVIDASRNLTNIGTITTSGAIDLTAASDTGGTGQVHLSRGGAITFYGNNSFNHAICSKDSSGNVADDIRINSYGAVYINLDSNINNTGGANFIIGRHGQGAGTISTLLTVDGEDGSLTATGNVTAYSDKRLKENIQTLDSKKALQMRGVSFIKDGVEGSGVIAQEIEEIAPELVLTADDEMGTKSVAYGNLVGYLIETVKDQQKQIDKLKQRLDNDSSN